MIKCNLDCCLSESLRRKLASNDVMNPILKLDMSIFLDRNKEKKNKRDFTFEIFFFILELG